MRSLFRVHTCRGRVDVTNVALVVTIEDDDGLVQWSAATQQTDKLPERFVEVAHRLKIIAQFEPLQGSGQAQVAVLRWRVERVMVGGRDEKRHERTFLLDHPRHGLLEEQMIRHPTVHALIDGIAVFEIRALEAHPCMDRLHVPEATGGAASGYREIASLRQDRRESAILPISIAIRDGRAAHRME